MSSDYIDLPINSAGNAIGKGTKTIFCIDNGDFATGQDAINSASPGDTILFGAKSGGWGDIVVPAGKKLSLKGLQSERCIYVQMGSLTFSPASGTQIVENELYIDSLYFIKSTGTVVTFDGTAPARLRMSNCFILSSTNRAVECTNTYSSGGIFSSAYFTGCTIQNGGALNPAFETSTPYVQIRKTEISNGSVTLKINAGTTETVHCEFTCNTVNTIANVAASGAYLLSNNCLYTNSTTNGTGVTVATGAVFANFLNVFAIATGTGYCVKGTGIHLYAGQNLSNSAALAYNVKMQSTLTNLPYTTTFTSAP
jgi:hypothetical protein